ncbi:DNA/RNA helicase domain-containing protein [Acidisphaera sp. L21]|uniref:DNA/RNA helicase domain-containing protein n=1 Tax=Acidisphaera sp. L21 TaxID=1641851 RepID=UPI00131E7B60|nr:DNA/RNA helicase domain-containing protein [Acidisphaera sp. L21]
MLYARHGVADIANTHASAQNLTATRTAIADAFQQAASIRRPTIIFVTGIPGAGKTLCGLDTAFAGQAAFLTGNPSLVHVLREALARDSDLQLRAARQRMEGVIQALPSFRDHYAKDGIPPERVVVIDEAQRCWSKAHAAAKTATSANPLRDSEPALLLDIMARRDDGPVLLCLIGTGQEIHDGEGGLAEWGIALRTRPAWYVLAAPSATEAPLLRHRLPVLSNAATDPAFHLDVPVRSLRNAAAPAWVDAVLAGDTEAARAIARDGIPFSVTRDLATARARLRRACRGTRRAGLLCSSGARRLRAEGLGATLPHDDPAAVARWFLDRFPDIRASDALEVAATEFFAQGLELDAAGLCWDGDLVREAANWACRAFRGTTWTRPRNPDKLANKLNAYRVLLTRARYETVIWVPPGDNADPTRDPDTLNDIAGYLLSCGAHRLGSPR